MCGISGFWKLQPPQHGRHIINRMTKRLSHRGPDGQNVWCDDNRGVYLGHRRLAIIDVSSTGDQPMASASGRYVIVFNGEIYNFQALRKELEANGNAPHWRGHSDTEVLLALIESRGFENALKALDGMFAIALFDRLDNRLFLARDRIGEKPLYFGWQGNTFMFASELKSLRMHPEFENLIHPNAVKSYFARGYIGAPLSIYTGISKLEPGCYLIIGKKEMNNKSASPVAYWNLDEQIPRQRFAGTELEALGIFEKKLQQSVCSQMVSDVPLGAFLSGGVDSSTIVALMQKESPRPVKTFTIGFSNENYNEAHYARAVANHLGTEHYEHYIEPKEAIDVVPLLSNMYDEPFADSSQIPTHLVSKIAREQVTVSLSGDGGDELFGGYNRYRFAEEISGPLLKFPSTIRKLTASALDVIPSAALNVPFFWLNAISKRYGRNGLPGDKLKKLAPLLRANDSFDLYCKHIQLWDDCNLPLKDNIASPITRWQPTGNEVNLTEQLMAYDMKTYLPGDILTKVDRAAMAVGLETRVPLLDHNLVSFIWSLPYSYKNQPSINKYLLRKLLYKYVPKELIERPKVGFGVPIAEWLRGPLKEWSGELLTTNIPLHSGFVDVPIVRKLWDEHQSGQRDHASKLWAVLMFLDWQINAQDIDHN